MRIRPGLSLRVYSSAGDSFPFVVDEGTKYSRRISSADADLFRRWSGDEVASQPAVTTVETSNAASDDGEGASGEPDATEETFRELGFLDEGIGRQEVEARLHARWRRENLDALGETLAYAAATMPMYKGRIPASGDPQSLSRIPILSRVELRSAFPRGYARDPSTISKGIQSGAYMVVESSGTTSDERSRVVSDNRRAEIATVNGRFINRALWPGTDHRQATLTTLHCAGLVCARDLPQMELRTGPTLTLLPPEDPTAPTIEEITRILKEMTAYGTNLLRVHPVYLAQVTWGALDRGLKLPKMSAIVTTFEYRSKIHTKMLAEAWGCSVFTEYSVSEIRGLPMVECERNVYHVNDRFYRLEVLRDGKPVGHGEVGRLVATTLRGRLPLVRYDTGDLVIADDGKQPCPCGALHSIVGRIAGRARDALSAPNGRLLTTADVDDNMSTVEGVRFYQLVRESTDEYMLAVVADPARSKPQIEEAARAALGRLLGTEARLRVDFVSAVFPERSGKFRLTVSNVPPERGIRAEAPESAEPDAFAPLA